LLLSCICLESFVSDMIGNTLCLHLLLLRVWLLLCCVIYLISEPYVCMLSLYCSNIVFVAKFSVCPSCNFSIGVLLLFDIIGKLERLLILLHVVAILKHDKSVLYGLLYCYCCIFSCSHVFIWTSVKESILIYFKFLGM
jgi:hypothetical protein